MKNKNNGMDIPEKIKKEALEILSKDIPQKEKDRELRKLKKLFIAEKTKSGEMTYSELEDLILSARISYLKLSEKARFMSLICDSILGIPILLSLALFLLIFELRNLVMKAWLGVKAAIFFPFKIIAGLGLKK